VTGVGSSGLSVENLSVRYGNAHALFGVSFEVLGGGVLAILGTNGAGKSTLGRAVAGLIPASAGRVWFGDTDITKWPAHRVRRAGLTYIPEGRGIFPGLSVIDNLRMATRQLGGRSERQAGIDRALELFPAFGSRLQLRAANLSGGQQQMLALARALAVDPQLVIADEMSLGLAPLVVDQVFETLRTARDSGITIVLIEQFIHRAIAFADSCVILTRGTVGWNGPASDAGDEVLRRYLGGAEAGEGVA
jgi:branched-chain amino acid transport system ATP-binding protein